MHSQFLLLATVLAANVNALPLNINLGAYSPALVVGDGEISFGGKADVSNLMNALEGAAVAGAANAATAATTQAAAAVVPAASTAAVQQASTVDNTQITSLQGMGKEIAPRVVQFVKTPTASPKEKRDINGFNAALSFATGALKTSPEVQLGTGEGGSGVGITQKAGGVTSTAPAKAARDVPNEVLARHLEHVEEKRDQKKKTTVTTMFVKAVEGEFPLFFLRQ